MNTKTVLINFILVILLFIHFSCSGENSRTLQDECEDIHLVDLGNSECLAESLLNVCNTFICPLGPTPVEFTFTDCMLIDCSSLQCDDRIVENLIVEDDFFILGTTLARPSNNEIEFMCSPLIQ